MELMAETYKHTDIGIIPSDWDIDYIKNLAVIKTGSRNTQDRIENGLYPFFVRSQTVERINSYSYDGEAVLTAGDGVGVGKVIHYVNEKFDCHQRVYRISDFSKKLNGYYFYLYFSNNFLNRIMQMTAKSSVDSVRMDMIANMQIPLPPTKTEQIAIAKALSDADALINSLEKLIAKKRYIKQGAMQQLLQPKEGDALSSDTERSGSMSKGWDVKKLGEIAELITKGTTPTSLGKDFQTSGINFIKIESLTTSGEIIPDKVAFIDESTHQLLKRSQLKSGDLLFSIAGALGRVAKVENEILPANTNQALAIIRLPINSELDLKYLFIYLASVKIQTHILNVSVQGAQANLSLLNISQLLIEAPKSKEEQTRIATILSDMDAEIQALETKLEKYRNIKLGMMQNLLTGKIRLV